MTPKLRCAIYTRKSSEEGLEQDFNSLHAQREACEAYIRSQAGEGWKAIQTAYDDGGISGGTMNRPSLQRLMADIGAGKVDVVVVYKVDRLTRSLMDFAKIVELFDRHAVSFVSVTQAFNTTSSMGRLTLNVLLSFAQFEREVTGERIRDKIAASKKKGLWMGGNLPLGYDADSRTLKVVEREAEQVRHIFDRYLALGSVHRLAEDLAASGVRSKQRMTRQGTVIGGVVMARGALFHLLSNRLYLGQIVHKGQAYPGQHAPIVDAAVFEAAQALLAENRMRRGGGGERGRSAPLTGLVFDEAGRPMSPAFSYGRGKVRYRYYVSTGLQKGDRAAAAPPLHRLPGSVFEDFVRSAVSRITAFDPSMAWPELRRVVVRIDVRGADVQLTLDPATLRPGAPKALAHREVQARLQEGDQAWLTEADHIVVVLPVKLVFRGGRQWIETPRGEPLEGRPRHDKVLIAGLRRAHVIAREASASPLQSAEVVVAACGVKDFYSRKLMRLAFLAPDIQAAILAGRQPANLMLQTLLDDVAFPSSWAEQRRRWRFETRPTQGKQGGKPNE